MRLSIIIAMIKFRLFSLVQASIFIGLLLLMLLEITSVLDVTHHAYELTLGDRQVDLVNRRDMLIQLKRSLQREIPRPTDFQSEELYSQILCDKNSYPSKLCTIKFLYLNHTDKRFTMRLEQPPTIGLFNNLNMYPWLPAFTTGVWPNCTVMYDEAFAFTIDFSAYRSGYFSLHMDTFLPLFSLLVYRKHFTNNLLGSPRIVLMPTVEDYKLQAVDWKTRAFDLQGQFSHWNQMIATFAGSIKVMPLTRTALGWGKDKSTCIKTAHFGVPRNLNISDPQLINGFSGFMRTQLGLPFHPTRPTVPHVCLIRRTTSRLILNEISLVSAISPFVRVQVVQFDGLSYREQIALIQRYTILVGMHGSGLTNAIYMYPGSVTIQMVPYKASRLPTEKYAKLLRARGPYVEWHNTYEQHTRANELQDPYNSQANTVVHIAEFVQLIKDALQLGINADLPHL